MRNVLLLAVLVPLLSIPCNAVMAQAGKLLKAQQHMESLQFAEARSVYERLFQKDNSNVEALVGLAEAYRKSGELEEAAGWYAKASQQEEVDPFIIYRYGQILLQLRGCSAAQPIFNQYLRYRPYAENRTALEDVCAYFERLEVTTGNLTTVSHPDFNQAGSDIAPAFYQDGLLFGSVRQKEEKGEPSYDLYFTQPTTNGRLDQALTYSPATGFGDHLNTEVNEAIVTFGPDEQAMYFTRNQRQMVSEKYPVRRLEILVSQKDKGIWSPPTPLPFNSLKYNTAHPALTPDGQRLFFASDRPGGFGGKDLYYVERIGDTWGGPINLGPDINTPGDELYPFYHTDGKLYFASEGHLGYGGLDIFLAEDKGDGLWSEVVNMGPPINSSADDFGLVHHDKDDYGFFTSNRAGGAGGDDIYAFQQQRVQLAVQFVNEAGEPLETAISFVVDEGEYLHFSADDGSWKTWLDLETCMTLSLNDERFLTTEKEVCSRELSSEEGLTLRWELKRVKEERPRLAARGVTSHSKALYGTVVDEWTGDPIADAKIQLRSADCGRVISISSGRDGRFHFPTASSCCYDIKVLATGYFNNSVAESICPKQGLPEKGLTLSLAPYHQKEEHGGSETPDPSPVQKPSVTGFAVSPSSFTSPERSISYVLNVYYDTGRSSVRAEAIPELNRLYELMVDNPNIVVEVSSHTDARGTSDSNRFLSQRRANAIVRWLKDKGIAEDRLLARGYGEDELVNNCWDGAECSEEEHQLNRRTEFRVLGPQLGQSH